MHTFQKALGEDLPECNREINHKLASLQAIAEFCFLVIKRQFGITRVRYRGLFMNSQALTIKFALANLHTVRRLLLAALG